MIFVAKPKPSLAEKAEKMRVSACTKINFPWIPYSSEALYFRQQFSVTQASYRLKYYSLSEADNLLLSLRISARSKFFNQ